jgi:hypothetical protein
VVRYLSVVFSGVIDLPAAFVNAPRLAGRAASLPRGQPESVPSACARCAPSFLTPTIMPTFLTLGPEDSNHQFVLQRYLAAQGLGADACVVLIEDFHDGARRVIACEADYLLQCAVHPAAAEITGTYRRDLHVIDAFICPSRPMALVRARRPRAGLGCVAVQPATQTYVDLSGWATVIHEPTVSAVQQGLLSGRYEAGIAFSGLAERLPEDFELIERVGTVCDAWVMFGREAVHGGDAVVWTGSPASRQYQVASALSGGPP